MFMNQEFLKQTLWSSGFILASAFCSAQEKDSINAPKNNISEKVSAGVAEKFPMARLVNVEYDHTMPYKFTSKYLDSELPEGKVNSIFQVKVSSNITLIRKKKWSLGTTLNYQYFSANTDGTNFFNNQESFTNHTQDFHYHSESLNLTYYSKLFNKIIVFSGTATVDGSEQHFERVRGLVTATMVLKANAQTKMTIGLVGLIDPTSIVPTFITFSYEHKFNNGWMIDAILPKWIYLRKDLASYGRLSVGTELGATMFYLYNNDKAYTFSQMDINSGVMYEHRLGKSFILSAKTGMRYSPTSRLVEKNQAFKDYVFESKPKPSLYFNVGISFNPFKK
jgi:hypothetical protein